MEPDTPVSIDTAINPNQPVSIDTNQPGNPLPSSNTADIRSKKVAYSLGELLGKSSREIYSSLSRGEEQNLRVEAAQKLDALNEQKRIDNLIDLVHRQGKTLTMDQMESLRKKPTDPNEVFERGYAEKFLNGIYGAAANIGDTALDSATIAAPDAVSSSVKKGEDAFSNIEYARTKLENIQDQYQNQGWIPWLVDQGKNIIPFYSDVKLRGWMKDTPAIGFQLQGANLYDQTRELLRMQPEDFRAKYDEIMDKLSSDNPTLAVQFANAVLGMSYSDQALASVNNIIDIAGLPGLTTGIKSILKDVNTVRGAISDGIKASGTARPDKASVAEGFGDTGTAAVEKTTQITLDKMADVKRPATNTTNVNTLNDPIRRAKEALPTGFITDKNEIAANPGPLSRELTNRILQQQDVASNRIIDVIENTAKVQRIPIEEATKNVMTVLKEEAKNNFGGIKNAILDIGDPVYNPFGNNYNWPVRIGNWTGEQFSSEAQAIKFAKEHNILEYDIAGKEGAKYYLPEAAVKRPFESKSRLGEVRYKDGELRVFTDDGAEVQLTHRPNIGHIPITVDGKGKVTFHPTITSNAEVTKAVAAQQGLGFHLLTWKPLDESQHVLKDLSLSLESTKSLASKGGAEAWANTVFGSGYARSSDNTLSPFEIHQRKTATYSISRYQKLLQDEMKMVEDIARGRVRVDPVTGEDIGRVRSYISSLLPGSKVKARKTYKEFQRALAAATDMIDPKTGKPGYFFRSPEELNEFYVTNFQRPPSFEETQGYFAFVRNYENDRILRSVREYTNKVRLGAEQHQVSYIDAKGDKLLSGFFDGVTKKELPSGEYPILDLMGAKPEIRLANRFGATRKEVDLKVSRGEAVVTEAYAPELRPFKDIPGVGNSYVRYVVTPSGRRETKSLDWNQVNRLSGGHFVYDYENYIKEAKVSRNTYGSTKVDRYEGDTTFMAISNRSQGKQIVKVLNEVKAALREKNVPKAKRIFIEGLPGAQGPAMEWKDFYRRTLPTKDKNGVLHPPQININEPFHVVPRNKSILDLDRSLEDRYTNPITKKTTFKDGTKSGSLAQQYQVGFTQERDSEGLMALRVEGTKTNPIYKYEPAKFADPITTMNRALNQITGASFMDDMKIAAIENSLREAEPFLKADPSEVRSAPYHHWKSMNKDSFKSAADQTAVANILSNRFKTQQFLGVPSKYDAFMHNTSQRIADWMYDTMGPKAIPSKDAPWYKKRMLIPIWLIDHTTSPVDALRTFAYHAKMGVFALPQIITQLMSYATINSVAPRSAVGGGIATMLHQWSRFKADPAMLDALDRYASKINIPGFHQWKPGYFKEAMQELDRRGFANVGEEYSTLNTQLKHEYIKGEAGAFLDVGQYPFKYSEQHVRYGAWYTAALEYRSENPNIKVMRRSDWDKVLDRADDLSGNMSRASSSILQSGPLSLTGQFLTYQMHLAELFWGKRLGGTRMERNLARTRMLVAYGALFGVPMGLGITGLPLSDYIRKYAIDHGYVIGDNWLSSAFMEGIPALFAAWATSDTGDIKNGNWYNVSKLGAGGFTQLNNLLSSDANFWEFVAGASGSIMSNTIKNSSGFVRAMASMMPGSKEDEAFPMKLDDFVDVFKEITSVNQTWKAIVATSTGKWLSKNESYQADVSKANAIFMSLTGLDLTNAADNYNVGQLINEQKEAQKYALNRFIREFRRGVMSANDNDWSNYNDYMRRAFSYLKALNYPEEKYPSAIAIASKGYETRVNQIREDFYTRNVPAGREQDRMDSFRRYLQTQEPYRGPNLGPLQEGK